jgi:hypothetical protein
MQRRMLGGPRRADERRESDFGVRAGEVSESEAWLTARSRHSFLDDSAIHFRLRPPVVVVSVREVVLWERVEMFSATA